MQYEQYLSSVCTNPVQWPSTSAEKNATAQTDDTQKELHHPESNWKSNY